MGQVWSMGRGKYAPQPRPPHARPYFERPDMNVVHP